MILHTDPNEIVLEAISRTPALELRGLLKAVTNPRRFPYYPVPPDDLLEFIKNVDWEPYNCATTDEQTQTFICSHLAGLTSWLPIQDVPDGTPVFFYKDKAGGVVCRAPVHRPMLPPFSVLTIVQGILAGVHPGDPMPMNRAGQYPLNTPVMVREAERLGATWVLCCG